MKLAHIVNSLVVSSPDSDLYYAQPITLESMRVARRYTADHSDIEVEQLVAVYPEDLESAPADFVQTEVLQLSVLDHVEGLDQERKRKLPLLRDLLDRLYEASPDADYLVYSNIDIGLQKNFYLECVELIEDGLDAFTIGRRTVSEQFTSPDELDEIQAQEGEKHYGYSCFVFPRGHYPRYMLGTTCIGLQPIGVTLAVNMIYQAARFRHLTDRQLTFHLGDDRVWNDDMFNSFHRHNERELDGICKRLPRSKPKPQADRILAQWERRRSNAVIDKTTNRLVRFVYRVIRKLGFVAWVGKRYDRVW